MYLWEIVRTLPAGIQRPHVEDIDTLHLSEDFQTLKTGRLLKIGWDGTLLTTWGQKVLLVGDFCAIVSVAVVSHSGPNRSRHGLYGPSNGFMSLLDWPGFGLASWSFLDSLVSSAMVSRSLE